MNMDFSTETIDILLWFSEVDRNIHCRSFRDERVESNWFIELTQKYVTLVQ